MTQLKNASMVPPANIAELKNNAGNKSSAKIRLAAVNELGKHACQQSIDILWRLMLHDLVWEIQEAAFLKLQAFGEEVKLPKKKKGNLIKGVDKKITKLLATLTAPISYDDFRSLFQSKNSEAYDVYQWDKKGKFDQWLSNIIKSNTKELAEKVLFT